MPFVKGLVILFVVVSAFLYASNDDYNRISAEKKPVSKDGPTCHLVPHKDYSGNSVDKLECS